MFEIICIAGFVLAVVALALIVLAYLKDGSLVLPYAIFFVGIVVFGVSLFLHLKGVGVTADDPPTSVSDAPSAAPEQDPDDTQQPAETQPAENHTPAVNKDSLSIGDSATLGDWGITVTDFYFADKIETGTFGYFHPDEGNQYAVVAVQATNNGTKMDTFLPPINTGSEVWANLYYASKYEYSPSFLPGLDEDLNNETINPLITKDGIVAFAVPDVVASSEEPLSVTFSIGRNEKITFSLR